jgi:hypothetical protein
MTPGPHPRSVEDRFWEKVQKTQTCWLWTSATNGHGYGVLRLGGRLGKSLKAHRLSWQFHHGEIPEGKQICHRCDIRHCVNPSHLFLGTKKDNMEDASQKGRLKGRNVARGENVHQAKLTEIQAREIYFMSGTQIEIASKFGVSQSEVSRIKHRDRWKHLV